VSVEWKEVSLGEVCKFQGGSQPPKSTFVYESKEEYIRLIQIRDYKSDKHIVYIPKEKAKRFCTKEDVMIGRYGPPVFQILRGIEGSYNVALMKAVPNEKVLTKDYLFYFLGSPKIQKYIIGLSERAAGQSGLNKATIEPYPILLPPIKEQKRIVAMLDEAFAGIDAAIANTQKNLSNARELFESYLNNVFSQRGEGGSVVTLSDLTSDITDGDHSPPPKSQSGIPFITISNVDKTTNKIDFSHTFFVTDSYYHSLKSKRKPKLGDVLYTVTGSYGIPVLVSEEREFCFQRHIGLLRPKEGVDSSWLYYLLMSPLVFRQASEGATGTAQKTVGLKVLREIKVLEMTPQEQKEVVAVLDDLSVDTQYLQSIYQQKLTALNELKQSLLQKAFSGELTATDAAAKAEAVA